MALWNWWWWEEKTFINLKLVAPAWPTEEQPKFVKLGEDFKLTNEKFSELKGKLIKLKNTFTPAKGKMGDIYWFKAFFEDWEEIYVVESTITNASKDLLNTLLVNIWTVLKVNLYLNKSQYPTSSIKLEDWGWAETAMAFNEIDVKELYNRIWALDTQPENNEDINIEDVPF